MPRLTLIAKSDTVTSTSSSTGSSVGGGGSTGSGTGMAGSGLGELLRKMHSSLVSQIKSVLTHLQVSTGTLLSVS